MSFIDRLRAAGSAATWRPALTAVLLCAACSQSPSTAVKLASPPAPGEESGALQQSSWSLELAAEPAERPDAAFATPAQPDSDPDPDQQRAIEARERWVNLDIAVTPKQ